MDRFFDLRFVIGLFFVITGGLLVIYSRCFQGADINLYSGLFFLLFGLMMMLLTRSNK